MGYPIKIDQIDNSLEFYEEVILLIPYAQNYLYGFKWCKNIQKGWLFTNIGTAICIFLFEVENLQAEAPEDNYLWVIVGDLPRMYLVTFNVETTKDVILDYIDLTNEWISNVEKGLSLEDCYPIVSEKTPETLNKLKMRIKFLDEQLVPNMEELSWKLVMV
jgi:hypothetical protein